MGRLKCFSLLLGARNTPAAGQHFSARDDAEIHAITFRHFPNGFTVLNAEGGWFDPAQGRFIQEDSRQILVCAPRLAKLRMWCDELARALQQKELLVVEVGAASTFRTRQRAARPRKTAARSTSRGKRT